MTLKTAVQGRRPGPARATMTNSAKTSMHDRILSDVRNRIISGGWEPGQRIPSESDLATRFGCSRMTVNKVLSLLARAGLIERRRKAGSFVSRPRSRAAILEIQDIKMEVESLGQVYGYRLLERAARKSTRAVAADLGVAPQTSVLALSCLHTADGRPFCFEKRVINLEAVPSADGEPFEDGAAGPWLVAHVPWSEGRHAIRAISADDGLACALDINPGLACLVVERRTWANGRPITCVTFTYPGPLRELVAVFKPAQ